MADLALIGDERWCKAQRRADVVRPLAARKRCSRAAVRAAAAELGLSERHVYTLVRRCRDGHGEVTALLPAGPSGGRGKSRLSVASEALIHRVIDEFYLAPQKHTAAALIREVHRRCRQAQLRPPSDRTIRRRLKRISAKEQQRRGERRADAVPVHGPSAPAFHPFDLVQMDHAKVDLILVDPVDREPIGRPWLTVAIDVHSRCIAGFHLALEPPSATSVGLCLTHVAAEKAPWLERIGVEANWPVAGKPAQIGVDNAREFHSVAFERGCKQHGIAVEWRPPGRPHFGGIVERVIGTLMELVHALPGTTFSNAIERGSYDSDKAACLTLEDLERWLAVAIAKYYHMRPHEGLDGEQPLRRHEAGLQALAAEGRTVPAPRHARTFLIDFLPVVRRSLRRDGITIDHITYFSHALRSWIAARDRPDPLLIRRDPRDLSRIFVLDPKDDGYLEVPYRTLQRPTITLWEHRLALRRLRARRCGEVDEAALFAAVEEMRAIEHEAMDLTRTARRDRARRRSVAAPATVLSPAGRPLDAGLTEEGEVPRAFDEIERW